MSPPSDKHSSTRDRVDEDDDDSTSESDFEGSVITDKDGDRNEGSYGSLENDSDINNLSSEMEKSNISDRRRLPTQHRHRKSPRRSAEGERLYPDLEEFKSRTKHIPQAPVPVTSTVTVLSFCNIAFLIVIAVVGTTLFGGFVFFKNLSLPPSEDSTGLTFVDDIDNNMRSIFANQSLETWRIVRSQLGVHLPRRGRRGSRQNPPTRPAIVLVTGFGNGTTLRCFSRKLGAFVAQSQKRTVCIRADAEENQDSGHLAKMQMDEVVKQGHDHGDRCFHVQRLDNLSGPELLMLHAWCDGDFSPYKDSVFIFTMLIKSNITRDEKNVNSYIDGKWSRLLGPDEAPALLSRVANNLVIVREEEHTEEYIQHCLT